MKNILFKFITILILLTIPFKIVVAQTEDSTKQMSLDEVIISANKVWETKKEVAQQMQIIGKKQIELMQARSTADILPAIGISVQKSQLGGGSPVLRGFEASRIGLVMDGIKLNNLIYRAGHLQDIIKTDPLMLDRVEVLYGPSSTLFGSDALGGIIYMQTKNPKFSDDGSFKIKAELSSSYASAANALNGHANINYGNSKWAGLTAFTYSKFDDLKSGSQQNPFADTLYGLRTYYAERINGKDSIVKNDDVYLQKFSGYSQYDFIQKFAFQQNEKIRHNINVQYSTSTDVPRYDRLTDPHPTKILNSSEWYYGPQSRLLTAYSISIRPKSLQELNAGINYQNLEESRHNRNFGASTKNHRIENVQVIGANINGLKKWNKHDLRFGLEAQFNSLKSTANKENITNGTSVKLDTRYPDGDNTMNNIDVYASHLWKIKYTLHIVDGLRLGYSNLHSTLVDTALLFHLPYTDIKQQTPVYSANLGLLYFPCDAWKLSLLSSTGFRVPNVDDLAKIFGSTKGKVIVPNKDLKPEKTLNFDLGIQYIVNEKMNFENHIFYTDFTDIAVVDSFELNGQKYIEYDDQLSRVYANQNRDKAFIYGYSGILHNQWNRQWSTKLYLNYTYGRLKATGDDIPLDHIPPMNVGFNVAYAKMKWLADFNVSYSAEKKLNDYSPSGEDNLQYATADGMPAWMCLDLHARYAITNGLYVSVGVENILDTQYRTFSSGINAPGRNILIGLKYVLGR